jgi:DNA-directed RNA polymerase subunit K
MLTPPSQAGHVADILLYHVKIKIRKLYNGDQNVGRPSRVNNMRYTRFERARIIGARGLQISMGAPVLMKVPDTLIDPIDIATQEFELGMLPITVKRDI